MYIYVYIYIYLHKTVCVCVTWYRFVHAHATLAHALGYIPGRLLHVDMQQLAGRVS